METLRSLRQTRALTLFDLATLTGIPARAIAEVEYGLRRLAPAERETLAFVLGLDTHELTGAQRRSAQAQTAALPLPDQRALQALLALALSATLATGSLGLSAGVERLNPPQLGVASAVMPNLAALSAAQGALAAMSVAPMRAEASQLWEARLAELAELAEQAQRQREALSPPLVVGPTPGEAVAPAPRPGIAVFRLSDAGPSGCPVAPTAGRVVLTQGYGVGSHAPAAVWGAVDLAIDGNGDGYAEPASSWYQPIVATHDGQVSVSLESYPGGNYVSITDPSGVWRTGYAHLALVTVISDQFVRAGDTIGLMGSTGMSSGPHLDYQVWRNGVNIDPTALVGCE